MRKPITLGAAILFAACGGDGGIDLASASPFCQQVIPAVEAFMSETEAARPTPSDDRYGGTVVVGGRAELVGGMNAAGSMDYHALQHQQFVNLMTLLDYDRDATPRPYLAESWEISDDESEITFHIRRDVFWHDGEQTDAHDVAFSYRLFTNPVVGFGNAGFWDYYEQGEEGVEVVDDFTVKIRMRPHADFLDPWRVVGMLPEHLLGDVPPQTLAEHPYATECPVGNGPFVFASHAPQDRWVFTANPAFPEGLGGRPFIDRYVYRIIPDQTTLLTELLIQNLDVYISVPPGQAQRIVDDLGVDIVSFQPRHYDFVAWNSRRSQLADARVRRALTLGINRREIVREILLGYGTVAYSGVPPSHWAFDQDAAASVGYDPQAAAALLDEAGWRDRDGDGVRESDQGARLSISIKFRSGSQYQRSLVEIMQSQLARIGVEVRAENVEWGTLLDQISVTAERDFDGVLFRWVPDYRLDETDLFHSSRSDYPWALSGLSDTAADRLLGELSATVDRDAARPLWAEYYQVMNEVHPYTYLFFPTLIHGVTKRLRGVEMDARGDLLNIKDWYLDPASR